MPDKPVQWLSVGVLLPAVESWGWSVGINRMELKINHTINKTASSNSKMDIRDY